MTILDVKIGEKMFKFKRVNIATLKKHGPFLKKSAAARGLQDIDADFGFDGIFEMTQIIHECVVRAQPEVTLEQIEEEADEATIVTAFNSVMTGSGFVAEAAAPGEVTPASSKT